MKLKNVLASASKPTVVRPASPRRPRGSATLSVLLMTLVVAGSVCVVRAADEKLYVGSKSFTESVILGEMMVQLLEDSGATVTHRRGLGGTQVLWKGLLAGEIDVYPEYTGTLREEILAGQDLQSLEDLRTAVAEQGVVMSDPLGFNNTYAFGMRKPMAEELGIRTLSDLRGHPELKFGFSNEFLDRGDGWKGLRAFYNLPHADIRGLDHDLAYRGLESGAIDVIDLYTTDAEIKFYDLAVLEDDRSYFPQYEAVILYRDDLPVRAPEGAAALQMLAGQIDNKSMTALNAAAKLDRQPEAVIAAGFLNDTFGLNVVARTKNRWEKIGMWTLQHLYLVVTSMVAAMVVAIPLGILSAKFPRVGQVTLAVVGLLQTVPSLALFVVLIPLLGIGPRPAIVALFLYSLLAIVRNTYIGITGISSELQETAQALGLGFWSRLRLIELPLASPAILAGIKTAVVINVGTATLGGFIGARGYGEPIFTGIRLADTDLLLQGAIPAALMALVAQGLFEWLEHHIVPRGLRVRPSNE